MKKFNLSSLESIKLYTTVGGEISQCIKETQVLATLLSCTIELHHNDEKYIVTQNGHLKV
jgi:hypothetical protein